MLRNYRIVLLLFSCYSCTESSVNKATDADWRQWHAYLERAARWPDSSFQLADSALLFARSHGLSDTGFYQPWEIKASSERKAGRAEAALLWLDSAHRHASESEQPAAEARALANIGAQLLESSDWQASREPFQEALELVTAYQLEQEKPFVLLGWSGYLRRLGKPMAALDTLKQALELFRTAGNRKFMGQTHFVMGEIMEEGRDSSAAEAQYRAAWVDYAAMGDSLYGSRSLRRISGLLLLRNLDSATYFFKQAVRADPGHQLSNNYLRGLLQLGFHHLRLLRPNDAFGYMDSARQFVSVRKVLYGHWNAWLGLGITYLELGNIPMAEGALSTALSLSMEGGDFTAYQQELKQWKTFFEKRGMREPMGQMEVWSDPKRFVAREGVQQAKPGVVRELSPSRRSALKKKRYVMWGGGMMAMMLITFIGWRLLSRRRKNAYDLYRERLEKHTAARAYRRDTLKFEAAETLEGEQSHIVIERERKILALEELFAREKTHLDPQLTLAVLCDLLDEKEASFRAVVRKMYDIEFEELLEEYRIEEAIGRLKQGTPLAELHVQSGYHSPSEFRKQFKKVTGISPASFARHSSRRKH